MQHHLPPLLEGCFSIFQPPNPTPLYSWRFDDCPTIIGMDKLRHPALSTIQFDIPTEFIGRVGWIATPNRFLSLSLSLFLSFSLFFKYLYITVINVTADRWICKKIFDKIKKNICTCRGGIDFDKHKIQFNCLTGRLMSLILSLLFSIESSRLTSNGTSSTVIHTVAVILSHKANSSFFF